jgi:hypothetical protein
MARLSRRFCCALPARVQRTCLSTCLSFPASQARVRGMGTAIWQAPLPHHFVGARGVMCKPNRTQARMVRGAKERGQPEESPRPDRWSRRRFAMMCGARHQEHPAERPGNASSHARCHRSQKQAPCPAPGRTRGYRQSRRLPRTLAAGKPEPRCAHHLGALSEAHQRWIRERERAPAAARPWAQHPASTQLRRPASARGHRSLQHARRPPLASVRRRPRLSLPET